MSYIQSATQPGQSGQPKSTADSSTAVRVGVVVGGLVVLALFSSVIWAAVTAGVGLILIAVIGMLFIAAVQALPLLGQKWENKLLSARKSEARQNPIEQLQGFFLEKTQRVAQFKQAVAQIGAQIMSLEGIVNERKRAKPGYDASEREKSIVAMKAAHQKLKKKYELAEQALVQLQDTIEEQKFNWKFAQAGQQAINSINASSGEDIMNSMLAGEAFDSVRDNFNQVFADLEMEASSLDSAKQLSFDGGMSLDVSGIQLPAFQSVH